MREETGYDINSLYYLGGFYPSLGASNEKCYMYYAVCGEEHAQCLEPLEVVKVKLLDADEIDESIRANKLQHSMALTAWLKYKLLREGK